MRECFALICMCYLVGLVRGEIEPVLSLINTRVWGPGVDRADKLHTSVRYFFIEPRDVYNQSVTVPVKYSISIKGKSWNGPCATQIWQINRYDGSTAVRYLLPEPCWKVEISVMHGTRRLGASPYKYANKLQTEYCYCPQKNLEQWLQQLDCPSSEPQILHDLFPYRALNFSTIRSNMIEQYHRDIAANRVRMCHYVVKNNMVYRSCYGQHVGHKIHMDFVLTSLARKTHLPDLELFVNLDDEPISNRFGQRRVTGPLPIFSWCGKEDSFDIVMPSYDIALASLEPKTRRLFDILPVQRQRVPWGEKKSRGFWRGSDTTQERLELVCLSQLNPLYLNASFTNFVVHRNQEKKYGPKSRWVKVREYFNYRFLISMDGIVVNYRLPYLLAGTSVVFKQDSKYYEHYYSKMRENVEYVPFKADLSDLMDKLEYARWNSDAMLAIRDNAKAFVEQNLLPERIVCYFGLLFTEYAKRIVSSVEVLPGMEIVDQPATCDCLTVYDPKQISHAEAEYYDF